MVAVVVSQFNGTSTPEGSYSAKQVIMIATSIKVATVQVLHCVRAIRYQAKSEQIVRQDLIPRVRHGEAALMHPFLVLKPWIMQQTKNLTFVCPLCTQTL